MAGPPTNLSVVAQTNGNTALTWTNNAVYSSMAIHRKVSGGSYAQIDTVSYPDASYTDTESLSSNTKYYWKVVTNLGDSGEDGCTQWTITPAKDTMDISDYKTVSVAFVVSKIETLGINEATEVVHETVPAEPQQYEVTETDTITMVDSYETALLTGQNWMYYLGSGSGAIYPYDKDYKGDADADIEAYFQTKALDFADQYPQYIDTWKTISKVYISYVDIQEYDLTVSISTDNGTTWTNSSQVLGNGSLTVKTAEFDFWVSGRFFAIKLSHSSNDRLFQWVRMKVEFEPHTDWFSTG